MKNNLKKLIVFFVVFLIFSCFCSQKANAFSLSLVPSSNVIGQNEQFYIDVFLNTEGEKINGIEGSVLLPLDNVSFVRAEEGQSIINLWIEKPFIEKGTIRLSGIITNGFDGVVDPFNPSKKLPGLITRLVFQGKKDGSFNFNTSDFHISLNDGKGTIKNILPTKILFNIQSNKSPYSYKAKDDTSPELSASVVRDPNLFNNKYVLVFDARDKKTGIKDVLVKEGGKQWKRAVSPYLLEDQTRHSIITIQAMNYAGSSIVMNIEPISSNLFPLFFIPLVVIFFVVLLFIIKKIYERNKKLYN